MCARLVTFHYVLNHGWLSWFIWIFNHCYKFTIKQYPSIYNNCTAQSSLNMAPKTHFTVPLKKAADKVYPSKQGRQATHTTEKIPLDCHGHIASSVFLCWKSLIIRYDKMVSHMVPTCALLSHEMISIKSHDHEIALPYLSHTQTLIG